MKNFSLKNSSKSTKLYFSGVVIGIALILIGGGFYFSNSIFGKAGKAKAPAEQTTALSETKVAGANAPKSETTPSASSTPTTPTPAKSAPSVPVLKPKTTTVYYRPVSTPAPSSSPGAGGIYSLAAAQTYLDNKVMGLVNNERAALGIAALRYNSQLGQAAGIRVAEEAIISFVGTDHVRPDGRSFDTVFAQVGFTGYTLAGENLLWGYQSTIQYDQASLDALATKMFTGWKNSPEHYAQIKNPNYNLTGLGMKLIDQNGRTYYFGIQEFARK